MRPLIFFVFLLMLVSSCDVYVVEPRYDPRNNVVGKYDVKEYSETYNDLVYYTIRIAKSSYGSEVFIENLYGANTSVEAYLDYDKIVIPYQVVSGYEIQGIGTVSRDYITFSYSVRDTYANTYTDFCEAEAFRY